MMSEHVAEKYPRCPRCGSPLEGRNPFLPSYGRYECGSYERDDTATIECYRRQLAKAQAEVERLRRERERLADLLRQVDVVMDGAAMDGVKSILAPQYQDDWALVHTRVREQIALFDGEKGGGGE